MSPETAPQKSRWIDRLRSLVGGARPADRPDLRASQRVRLPIPVRVETRDGDSQELRLRDASLHGICIDGVDDETFGDETTLHFEGYPEVCEPFSLTARIVRSEHGPEPAVAVALDRAKIPKDTYDSFRRLVLHYIHHRALLDKLERGFAEMRCVDCAWIGHVSERRPMCSRCGGQVRPVTRAPGPVDS